MNSDTPLVQEALALVATVVGLFVTQGLVSNRTEKLVTGLASVLVPLVVYAVRKLSHARVTAAKVTATTAVTPVPPAAPRPLHAGANQPDLTPAPQAPAQAPVAAPTPQPTPGA